MLEALSTSKGKKRAASSVMLPFSRRNGSPGRTRTCDQPVNSRLLYQLSYRGTVFS